MFIYIYIMNNNKLHYYGWNRIRQEILDIANKKKVVIIDYVDHHFMNFNTTVIDYEWYGIIHHTISSFSNNNISKLFKNIKFLDSLKYCKGIITLSEYNKQNIIYELEDLLLHIDIHVLKHPMPPSTHKVFDINLFNKSLNVYNIGGWLRNPYTIYKAKILYNNNPVNKIKLKGYLMNQYFPEDKIDFDYIVSNFEMSRPNYLKTNYNKLEMCRPIDNTNYYLKYLLEYISSLYCYRLFNFYKQRNEIIKILKENHKSVKTNNYLNNDEYLEMLTSSVIFCDYIDCSVSNTIVECILTGTPIILNRHPAIEEYLGKDYPLYFDIIYNKHKKVYNIKKHDLMSAHKHLLNIRNSCDFELDNFKSNLEKIIN